LFHRGWASPPFEWKSDRAVREKEEGAFMAKKVKIYTTAACHYCRQAKEYLTEKGVEFEAVDVSSDPQALQEMKKVSGGARSVPVISIGEKVIIGFEPELLDEALKGDQP